jgi:hypothetical protein
MYAQPSHELLYTKPSHAVGLVLCGGGRSCEPRRLVFVCTTKVTSLCMHNRVTAFVCTTESRASASRIKSRTRGVVRWGLVVRALPPEGGGGVEQHGPPAVVHRRHRERPRTSQSHHTSSACGHLLPDVVENDLAPHQPESSHVIISCHHLMPCVRLDPLVAVLPHPDCADVASP